MIKIFNSLIILFFALVSILCFGAAIEMATETHYVYAFVNVIIGVMLSFINGNIVAETLLKKTYEAEKIKVVYHTDGIDKIKRIPQGDWTDLRASEDVELKAGEFKLINLGVSMKLPKGYEAHLVPRSSTYKNFHIIQTNSMGVIDNSYSGTNDVWMFPALATEDTVIHKNDRICQFRIVPIQPKVEFVETDKLEDIDRGGFGSTGKQ